MSPLVSGFLSEVTKLALKDGKPNKVVAIADAVRRDNPKMPDATAYRIAWTSYHKATGTKFRTPKKERSKTPLTGYEK